ncbi:MAG TPA: alpha-D-glucose phosphate-specific phosphoglucomutase [Gammaproteobacteria bacterium]|nr:alpha-D-glucose phosphate-specific phosphoglucomutase [Gammaproteobacteria bacterium]
MSIKTIPTSPFSDQKCGTAGLRRKVKVFRQPHYLENFIQSVFDCVPVLQGGTLVIGGDGRFFNREAIQTVLQIATANGVARTIVGCGGLLSTPAGSHLIRESNAQGGFLLTASHNPAGPDGDFGIKFNVAGGGQASESLTDAFHQRSMAIEHYKIVDAQAVDIDHIGSTQLDGMQIDIVDSIADYAALQEKLFDFDQIAALLARDDFRFYYDALHAVTGPYAKEIFVKRLGLPTMDCANAEVLADFGGRHPDPNPHDASDLVSLFNTSQSPDMGAASDGDGDRNMILGPGQMVSPCDSLAILTAHATRVPGYWQGLAGVARSMPTSRAVDAVAAKLNLPCYETPTGWRFFCNLLEDNRITLCGEESFGTSSNHCREKDGLWAILFWLNVIADSGLGVNELLRRHWAEYGRHYYQRQDYAIADIDKAQALMQTLESSLPSSGTQLGDITVSHADNFSYTDPVDGSVSKNQGLRITFGDAARIVYRLSGTGTQGATLRVYLEQFESAGGGHALELNSALAKLIALSKQLAQIEHFTELTDPSQTT